MNRSIIFLMVCMILCLSAGLLTGCSSPSTPAPEPEEELKPQEFTDDYGTATLRYVHSVDVEALLVATDETFTLDFGMNQAYPKAEVIMNGSGEGTQVTRISGTNAGETCYVYIKHTADYTVKGIYKPASCSFAVQIDAKLKNSQVIGDECGGNMVLMDTATFFYPPPSGLQPIPGSLLPVKLEPEKGVKILLILSDVVVPEFTGCQW
ncbi:MAG: hypothetical protein JXB38_08840 [Anaerolineales bacterium]|nr:hypothetical protein [Anaerolineales bacterium]